MQKNEKRLGFKKTTLGEVAPNITSGSRGWASFYSDEGALFLRMTNLPKNGIGLLLHNNKYVQLPKGSSEGKRTRVQVGDILVSITAELGKIGFVETDLGEAYVNQHVALIRVEDLSVHPKYLAYDLANQPQRNLLNRLNDSGAKSGLSLKTINRFPLELPPLSEQKAIAGVLSEWDRAISTTERLIKAKEKRFKWLVSNLVCNPNFDRGNVRDFTTEVSVRNKGQKIARVLSVTNHSGFVLPENQFARSVASSNLSNYKIVSRGQFAYNPSRINVGSIARLDGWNEGVLSPMYAVFSIDESEVNSDFFLHWLSSHEAKQRIKKSAQGSVRETVSFPALGSIPFPIPDLSEQKEIAETLNLAQREIELLKKLAEKQKQQKRGLMQKLLTGEWRVNVEELA